MCRSQARDFAVGWSRFGVELERVLPFFAEHWLRDDILYITSFTSHSRYYSARFQFKDIGLASKMNYHAQRNVVIARGEAIVTGPERAINIFITRTS